MDPIIKEKWCEALESGRYEQGTRVLATMTNTFCCLGVLCEVLRIPQTVDNYERRYAGSVATLPSMAVEVADLLSDNPDVMFDGVLTSVAELNDSGESFATIAKLIREQL